MQNSNFLISIRNIKLSDIEAVLELQSVLNFLDWNKEQYLREIESPSTVAYVAEINNKVEGFALFHLLADESELLSIAVSSEFQRNKIGHSLFNAGKIKLQEKGAQCLFLEVRESNEKAINFYQSLGAIFVGTRAKYYKDGESAHLYRIDF